MFEARMRAASDEDIQALLHPDARAHRETGGVRLYAPAGLLDHPFITVDEYREKAQSLPGLVEDVTRQADAVADHTFGYGTFVHHFGSRVDFNHDFGHAGMKYGWHYWAWGIPLVGAYALTRNERYAAAFADLFAQWFEQRDAVADTLANLDADVIWYELGLAVRTPVFIDACRLMAGSKSWPASVSADLLRTIVGHCRWLFECSAQNPFHAYNWPIQTAVTLRYAGTALSGLAEAPRWKAQGDAVVSEHLRRDFQGDGGYQERTPNYTRYVLDLLWIYARLLETHPPAAGEERRTLGIRERIGGATEECLAVWAGLTTPLGLAPAVNDTGRSSEMALLLTTASLRFKRPDFLGPARLAAEQTSPTRVGARAFLEAVLAPARDAAVGFPPVLSVFYPRTGFAVMRSDWTREARYLFLNLAPWSVHGHQDVLSFECYADGHALAVDPGIAAGGYGTDDYASWYRAARGHNMLCVEEADPARHLVDITDTSWQSGPALDFAAATHFGYAEAFGVRHRRHVLFVKPHFWIVWDRAWSERSGLAVDWFFHSPLALIADADGWSSDGGPGLRLAAAEAGLYEKRSGTGPADLGGLPGEPPHRAIDWVSFRWKTAGSNAGQDILVLVAPGKEPASIRRTGPAGRQAGEMVCEVALGPRSFRVNLRADGAEAAEK
jgi:hypothetical protein